MSGSTRTDVREVARAGGGDWDTFESVTMDKAGLPPFREKTNRRSFDSVAVATFAQDDSAKDGAPKFSNSGNALCGSGNRLFLLAEAGQGWLVQQREAQREGALRQLQRGNRIADHAGGCLQAALPASLAGVSH